MAIVIFASDKMSSQRALQRYLKIKTSYFSKRGENFTLRYPDKLNGLTARKSSILVEFRRQRHLYIKMSEFNPVLQRQFKCIGRSIDFLSDRLCRE